MNQVKYVTVPHDAADMRLDQFLTGRFPEKTRSYFTKLIKNGNVLVDKHSVKTGYLLRGAEKITVNFEESKPDLSPADIPLDIVYEDQHLLVINKPSGLVVHPGKGTSADTLVNALVHHGNALSGFGSNERPGIVHRLDKNTSGLLVVAKHDRAHAALQKQFADKIISRLYWALVWGDFEQPEGIVSTHIARSRRDPTKMTVAAKGKEAVTVYTVLERFRYVTLVQLELKTGRTHQIRVHMNYLHHPVVGDPDYNGRESRLKQLPVNLKKRGMHLLEMIPHQFLHAKILNFRHPESGKMLHFEVPLPTGLEQVLLKLPHLFPRS